MADDECVITNTVPGGAKSSGKAGASFAGRGTVQTPAQMRQSTIRFPPRTAAFLANANPAQVARQAPVDNQGNFDARRFVTSFGAKARQCIAAARKVASNLTDERFGRDDYIKMDDPSIEFFPDVFIGKQYPAILEQVCTQDFKSTEEGVQAIKDAVVVYMNKSMGAFSGSKGQSYYLARWDKHSRRNKFICMPERAFKEYMGSYYVKIPCKTKQRTKETTEEISLYEIYSKHANKRQFRYMAFDPSWNYEVSLIWWCSSVWESVPTVREGPWFKPWYRLTFFKLLVTQFGSVVPF